MPSSKTPAKQKSPEQINKGIIDNLGGSAEAHLRDKYKYHEQGLPFYTSVNGDNWTKELPNGEIHLVRRDVDLKTFEKKEIFIRAELMALLPNFTE